MSCSGFAIARRGEETRSFFDLRDFETKWFKNQPQRLCNMLKISSKFHPNVLHMSTKFQFFNSTGRVKNCGECPAEMGLILFRH